MKNKTYILRITQTAVFVALLVVFQAVTVSFGNTIVTGSVVNLLLILSVMLCGLYCGLSVAVLSPILAKFIGIGPLWSIIPIIILGNISLVLIWFFMGNCKKLKPAVAVILALLTASLTKFLVLYLLVVKIAVPLFLKLPTPQAQVVSGMFSIPQLITAIAGGAVAAALLPLLHRALKYKY